MKSLATALICLAVCALPATAKPNQPRAAATPKVTEVDGFGKAKFGMPLDDVRKLYPALNPAPPVFGAAYFRSANLGRYYMREVKIAGLTTPSDVEFRFWKGRFWMFIIYDQGASFDDAMTYLYKHFGKPQIGGTDPSWTFPKTSILTAPEQRWYSISDNAISTDAQAEFNAAVRAEQERAAAARTAAAAPPPTPAAAPTPTP